MARALWAVVAVVVLGVTSAFAQTAVRLPGGVWSFTLPATWKLADEAMLNKMNEQVTQMGVRTPDGPVRYVAMAVSQEGDGCYMLVQQSRGLLPGVSFESVVSRMQVDATKGAKDAERQMGQVISGSSLSEPEVDSERKLAVLTGRMDAAGVGGVKYFSCPMFGTSETITLHLYAPEGVFESKRSQLRGIIDSFAFDQGKAYEFSAGRRYNPMQTVIVGLIGGAVGLAVWAVRKATGRR